MSQNPSKALQKLQLEWLEDLEIGLGRSSKTAENYDRYLTTFFEEQGISSPKDITLEQVREFRRWLHEKGPSGEGVSAPTQNYYLIAIRQFLKYLAKQDIASLAPEKIELAKIPDRAVDVLYPEELDALFVSLTGNEIADIRDAAIIHMLFSTGLRVSELVALNRDDVREDSNELPIRGKGNKLRIVFLSPEATEAIASYEAKRGDMHPALFIPHSPATQDQDVNQDLRLTSRSIQRMIKKRAAAAGITKDISPHTLRHSFATDLLASGADVRQVQALLGHASITTTQVYTHLTDKELRSVHERFHRNSRK